jgi:GMP synthase (glutamine-hydrolysing)
MASAAKKIAALCHVSFEDLGTIAPIAEQRGFDVTYVDATTDDLSAIERLAPDLLVVLGGPIGVYEELAYPFLTEEIALVERRLRAGSPTLGICLGSQIMARALGARVYPAGIKEIGWAPIDLTGPGRRILAPLAEDGGQVMHWHGDTFDLPTGAELLASTEKCVNQAFSLGTTALALQFHPEVRTRHLERWFVGHTVEIAAAEGVTVERLRADTRRYGPSLEARGRRCLEDWIVGALEVE